MKTSSKSNASKSNVKAGVHAHEDKMHPGKEKTKMPFKMKKKK